MPMEPGQVRRLESQVEDALSSIFEQLAAQLPLSPTQRTMHLMAKAAVTVYETAVENQPMSQR